MSALGDYVHLSASGYKKHGTLRSWENSKRSFKCKKHTRRVCCN